MTKKHTCCAIVSTDVWSKSHQCGRGAKFERHGNYYCGTHDPEAVTARRDRQNAKWKAENDARWKLRRVELAAPDLLAALKDLLCIAEDEGIVGDNTTLARARAAVAKAEDAK